MVSKLNYQTSHGKTLKEAKNSLIFKISDRDLSEFDSLTTETILTLKDSIALYRKVTGACESGVKLFIESLPEVKDEYSVLEILEITTGKYNHKALVDFISKK